jgi:hypothetical protein
VLKDATSVEIAAFEAYLATGMVGRISTIETMQDLSDRSYNVEFGHYTQEGGKDAQGRDNVRWAAE